MATKKTRTVKKTRAPAKKQLSDYGGRRLKEWGGVISGITELDVQAAHQRIKDVLRSMNGKHTGSSLMRLLDDVAEVYAESVRLGAKGRAEYEIYKEDYATWLEAKKSGARIALEEEKKEKGWKKQITQDMVLDQVRVTWPDEYEAKTRQLKEFQAAVHELEALPSAVQLRANALSRIKDIIEKIGSGR